MKIALISQEYPPDTAHGGIATQTYMRAHGLSDMGHDVFVVSHSTDNNEKTYYDKEVRVTRIPNIDDRYTIHSEAVRWLTYSTEVAVAIDKLNNEHKLDLIVFPEWGSEGYIYLLNRVKYNYIPSIVHIHGPLVMFANTMNWPDINSDFYSVGTHMEGTCLKLADAVTASNECSAKWCIDHYDLTNQTIPVLYTGIDTTLFNPQNVSKYERPTIIFVGSLRRNKGVDLLVRAACNLAEDYPDLQLKVLGRGEKSYIDELKKIAEEAACSDLLDLPGFIHRQDLPLYLSQSHIFAGPSSYEGGPGNVYLEAMACGVPVVACSGSGVEGIITSQKNGLLVEPNNLDQLTNALDALLKNNELCSTLIKNAKKYVFQEADSKVCMKRLEQYYCCVANQSAEELRASRKG
jgi:glycosyltransferase involved in cell wall biosynthesis